MGVITTQASLLTKLSRRIQWGVDKPFNTNGHDVGGWASSWLLAGGTWSAGSTPPGGAGEALSVLSPGAMPLPAVPGGEELFLASLMLAISSTSAANAALCLYDRLVHTAGLSGTVTTTQAVASAALTRSTTGEGVQLFIEIYTTVGATQVVATVTYVNQAGATKTTSLAFGGTGQRNSVTMLRVPLAEGDTGVRSVTDVTLSATTGTAGAFGFTLGRPIVWIPQPVASDVIMDWADLALAKIPADACIAPMSNGTSARQGFHANLGFITA